MKPININWANPKDDYNKVYQAREDAIKRLAQKPGAVKALLEYYQHNWAQFICDWGMTFDPRHDDPERKHAPFILFPRQIEYVDWVYSRYTKREPGLGEKSRDVGFTWLNAAIGATIWLTTPWAIVGYGSRKKELVDNGDNDPDSILWKVRAFIDNLPSIFLPPEYKAGRKWGIIPHPSNNALIKGEIGDEIGRGGRAQPLSSKVLTPTGWTTIGELQVGDELIGADGKPTKILALHPQGEVPVYRVGFSDGSSTEACGEHKWQVTTPQIRKSLKRKKNAPINPRSGRHEASKDFLVLSTSELAKDYLIVWPGAVEARYHIPMVAPVQFASFRGAYPLSPYVVGVLLGDGHISCIDRTSPGFTSADPEVAYHVAQELPEGCEVTHNGGLRYSLLDMGASGRGHTSRIKDALYQIGLAGCTAYDKHIPEKYLYAPEPQMRLDLLQGLIDTDGWISERAQGKSCKVGFASVSYQLASDVIMLVRSLGGIAGLSTRKAHIGRLPGDNPCPCKESYTVTMTLPAGMIPARLSRKTAFYQDRTKYEPSRAIRSISYSRDTEASCVTVANPDGLYVTENFIVTHNSSIYFPDEFAHLDHQEAVESSLSMNTDCRIYISTVNGVGNLFYRLRHHLPSEQIFIFDWKEDPRKRLHPELPPEQEPWYQKQKADLLPTTLASQVDRDYNASVANSFIEGALMRDAQATPITAIEQPPDTPWRIGIDASGMGNDETVIWRRRGRISLPPIIYRKIDGVQMAQLVEKECERLLKSAPIAVIGIERDGPGGSCADQLKYGPYASITMAVHTGTKLADGENYNLRAWLHQQAKDYLTDNQVYLPNDAIFSTQGTAIQFSYKGGLLLIESKDEYRARFTMGRSKAEKASGRSPDRWDSFVLTFIPTRAKPIRTSTPKGLSILDNITAWRPLDPVMGY